MKSSLLNFSIPTDEEVLLASANSSVMLTPKEKFDLHAKTITHGSPKRIKKYNFKAIEHGTMIFLFNGLGKELGRYTNNFHGKRECRAFAFDHYMQSEDRKIVVGGYTYDFVGE